MGDLLSPAVTTGDGGLSSNPTSDPALSSAMPVDSSQSSTNIPEQPNLGLPGQPEPQEGPDELEKFSQSLMGTDRVILDLDSDADSYLPEDHLAATLKESYIIDRWHADNDEVLETRKKKAKRLAIQSNLYTQLIEDRLKVLERNVRNLLKLPPVVDISDDDDPDIMKPIPHDQSIKHLSWFEFIAPVQVPQRMLTRKKWLHGLEIDGKVKNVVEILIEEPMLSKYLNGGFGPVHHMGYDPHTSEPVRVIDPASYVPSQLRIRSPLMLKLLERITGQATTIARHKHQLVILRPFKVLVCYVDKIFGFLEELKAKLASRAIALDHGNAPNNVSAKVLQDEKAADEETVTERKGEGDAAAEKAESENEQWCRSSDEKIERTEKSRDNDNQEGENENPDADLESPEALTHLELLKELLENDLAPTVKLRKGIEDGTAKKVAFGDLWHVFRYGQEVRRPGAKQVPVQLYRVMKITGGRDMMLRDYPSDLSAMVPCISLKDKGYTKDAFIVDTVYWDFDGITFGPVSRSFIIRKYEGERDITSLPIYPLSLDPNRDQLRKELLDRGERFAELSNPAKVAHMQYQGLTLDRQPEQIESQIIIDFKLAFLAGTELPPSITPLSLLQHDDRETYSGSYFKCMNCGSWGCCGNDVVHPDYEVDQYYEDLLLGEDTQFLDAVKDIGDLKDSQKVLLASSRVYGFALRSRKWAIFDIDLVKDVEYADGWDNLVLEDKIKETVLALVKNHAREPQRAHTMSSALSSVDLVRGKGKGLIILLHGEPGVGKTSTAECVADHTRRPLFPITCGDIGDTAEKVEQHLETNFQLAHKWGCVLLLDEADVFLTRRSSTDLTRNAIVSVFLRTLEYYSGILFLTTNRVGNIDRAFKSRIHVALYYPKLDKESTYEVWKNNIERIKADFRREKKDFAIEKRAILKYSREHFSELKAAKLLNWNGRQIRNAFQTAIALAEYDAKLGEKPTLRRKHFEKVAEASRDFDQYLKDTQRGKDDAQLAQEEKSRNDAWGDYHTQVSQNIDQGMPWTPPSTRMQPMRKQSVPQPGVTRKNSAPAGRGKTKQQEPLTGSSDDTLSTTDDDEEEVEDIGGSEGVKEDVQDENGDEEEEGDGSDEEEGEEEDEGEEEEEEEPSSPPPTKRKKSRSGDKDMEKAKGSSSRDKESMRTQKSEVEKPKRKTKTTASSSKNDGK